MKNINFPHIGYGLLLQALVGGIAFALGAGISASAWIGAAFSFGFFISREYCQREGRLGITGHAQPWEGLLGWDAKSVGDAVSPIVACAAVSIWLTVR